MATKVNIINKCKQEKKVYLQDLHQGDWAIISTDLIACKNFSKWDLVYCVGLNSFFNFTKKYEVNPGYTEENPEVILINEVEIKILSYK